MACTILNTKLIWSFVSEAQGGPNHISDFKIGFTLQVITLPETWCYEVSELLISLPDFRVLCMK